MGYLLSRLLDVRLQRCGTLPTVWIPPKQVRDERDLFRTRMILAGQRTRLKNRIHATLSKYGLQVEGSSDAFNKKGRKELEKCLLLLPEHTGYSAERVLEQLDCTQRQIGLLEKRMKEVFSPNEEIQLLKTLSGIGLILAVVILSEIGEIGRFGSALHGFMNSMQCWADAAAQLSSMLGFSKSGSREGLRFPV